MKLLSADLINGSTLFFERSGPDKGYVMRLLTIDSLLKGYSTTPGPRAVAYKVSRLLKPFKPIKSFVPNPQQRRVFEGMVKDEVFQVKDVTLVEDSKTGRVSLPPEAFKIQDGAVHPSL